MSSKSMTRYQFFGLVAAVAFATFGTASEARAHHSIALEFDMDTELTVTGTITNMEWRNPHGWLHIEVTDENGEPILAVPFREVVEIES